MDLPQIRKPYQEYYGKWVQIKSSNGTITTRGMLRGLNEDGNLVVRPNLRYAFAPDLSQKLLLLYEDCTISLGSIGSLGEIDYKDVIREIAAEHNSQKNNLKNQERNPGQ